MDGATVGEIGAAYRTCEGLPADMDARAIGARVLELPEHTDLLVGGAAIDWLFRMAEKKRKGRRVIGACHMPGVQGDLSDLFDYLLDRHFGRTPDFLIVLDYTYWAEASALEREILCFHELRHARQAVDKFNVPKFDKEGMPVWTIVGHDVEEFDDVVRRYGAHDHDLRRFVDAARAHEAGA